VKPGRKRNPEASREAILAAAEKMFINKGFDGATLGEIAKSAGVHQSLIHHYFGAKLELYLEVMRRYLVNFGTGIRDYLPEVRGGQDFFREGVRAYFRFLEENPDSVRMGSWFNLFFQKNPLLFRDQSVGSPGEDQAQGYIYELIDGLSASLADLQRDGRVRGDIDPALILSTVFCLVEHWHEAKHRLLRRLRPDQRILATDEAYLEAVLKVVMEGILPR
jgi:AcrR family transcriptional regulator